MKYMGKCLPAKGMKKGGKSNIATLMFLFPRIDLLRGMDSVVRMKTRAEQFLLGLSVSFPAGANIIAQRDLSFSRSTFLHQNSAFFGVRGNGMTSRMFCMPVTKRIRRSKPSPKPACGQLP